MQFANDCLVRYAAHAMAENSISSTGVGAADRIDRNQVQA
jgi:hypothetical protein